MDFKKTVDDGLGIYGMGSNVSIKVQKISIAVSEPNENQEGDFNRKESKPFFTFLKKSRNAAIP